MIKQTYGHWELLLMDDGSNDGTLEIARGFDDPRIKLYEDGLHKGLPARLNETLDLARGQYYARMDGDDVSYPQRFERQVAYLSAHEDIDLVGSWMIVFGVHGRPFGKRTGPRAGGFKYSLLRTLPIGHPTFMGKIEWFRRYHYEVWPLNFQDQYLLLSSFRHSSFFVLPEILLGYREEDLYVLKQVRYRFSYFKAFPSLKKSLGILSALALVGLQVPKLSLDILAIASGLKYMILKNRAGPMTREEMAQWGKVWDSVNVVDHSIIE